MFVLSSHWHDFSICKCHFENVNLKMLFEAFKAISFHQSHDFLIELHKFQFSFFIVFNFIDLFYY